MNSESNTFQFRKSHRLLTKAEFQFVFDKAFKVNQKYLSVLAKPNQKPIARLGLIIGKRFAKSAVDRNKIKRILRESFRHHRHQLIGFDIIIIARQQCHLLDKATLREGIEKLWEKLLTQYQKYSSY